MNREQGNTLAAEQPITSIMTTDVIATGPGVSVQLVARILVEHAISGVPVLDSDGRLVGIITEMDIVSHEIQVDTPTYVPFLDAIFRMPGDTSEDDMRRVLATTAGQLMTTPVFSIRVDASVQDVETLMFERKVNPVPVLDHQDRLVGIVSRSDIVALIADAGAAPAD